LEEEEVRQKAEQQRLEQERSAQREQARIDRLLADVTDQLMEPPMFALKAPRQSAISAFQTG